MQALILSTGQKDMKNNAWTDSRCRVGETRRTVSETVELLCKCRVRKLSVGASNDLLTCVKSETTLQFGYRLISESLSFVSEASRCSCSFSLHLSLSSS